MTLAGLAAAFSSVTASWSGRTLLFAGTHGYHHRRWSHRAAPCTVAYNYQCQGLDPAYLASGALSYGILRLSRSGAARASLVAWQAGRRTTLLSLPAGMQIPFYDITAQGQAIGVNGPARPKGPWMIWRWSGGAAVEITALPPLGASPYCGSGRSPGECRAAPRPRHRSHTEPGQSEPVNR